MAPGKKERRSSEGSQIFNMAKTSFYSPPVLASPLSPSTMFIHINTRILGPPFLEIPSSNNVAEAGPLYLSYICSDSSRFLAGSFATSMHLPSLSGRFLHTLGLPLRNHGRWSATPPLLVDRASKNHFKISRFLIHEVGDWLASSIFVSRSCVPRLLLSALITSSDTFSDSPPLTSGSEGTLGAGIAAQVMVLKLVGASGSLTCILRPGL